MNQQQGSESHNHVIFLYGLFMVAWSVLDGVVQAGIMKQLGITPERAQILTAGMQFRQRVSVLCSMLLLEGDKDKEAIRLLQRIEKSARAAICSFTVTSSWVFRVNSHL